MRTVPHLVPVPPDTPSLPIETALVELRSLTEKIVADIVEVERLLIAVTEQEDENGAHMRDYALLLLLRLYEPGLERVNFATIAGRLADPKIAAAARRRSSDAARFDLHLLNIPHLYRETCDTAVYDRCRDARDRRLGSAPGTTADIGQLLTATRLIVDTIIHTIPPASLPT